MTSPFNRGEHEMLVDCPCCNNPKPKVSFSDKKGKVMDVCKQCRNVDEETANSAFTERRRKVEDALFLKSQREYYYD
jgi:hypothetical protein